MKTSLYLITLLSTIMYQCYCTNQCQYSFLNETTNDAYKQHPLSTLLIDSSIQRLLSYINSYSNYISRNIILYTPDYLIYAFDSVECLRIPEIESIAYLNFDLSQLIAANIQNYPQLKSVFVIYYRTHELIPQCMFYLYNTFTRQKIPVTAILNTDIEMITTSTINKQQMNLFKKLYEHNEQQGINVFDANDKMFNDFCFGFYDEETDGDVVVEDRRKYFYTPLCDEDYTLMNISWDKANDTVVVNCKTDVFHLMTNGVKKKVVNGSVDAFFEKDVRKGNVFECGDTAFEGKNVKTNFAFWLILIFIIIQIVIVIVYFACYFKKYKDYLDLLDNKINISSEEEEERNDNGGDYMSYNIKEKKHLHKRRNVQSSLQSNSNNININNNNEYMTQDSNQPYHGITQTSNRKMNEDKPITSNDNDNNNNKYNDDDIIIPNDSEDNYTDNYDNNNINNKETHFNSPPPNPPIKNKSNLINDNNNNNNLNTNTTNNNTINIETVALSKQVNTECIEPILRKKNTHRRSKKETTFQEPHPSPKDFNNNSDPNLNGYNSNTNIKREYSNKDSTNGVYTRSGSKLRSNASGKRSTLRRSTQNRSSIRSTFRSSAYRNSYRRNTSKHSSKVVMDSIINEKEYNQYELTTLSIDKAIIHDKRSLISIYLATLCDKLFLINLCNCFDISEPFLLRLFAFVFDITCLLFWSAIFFNETYISNRFIYTHTQNKKINYIYVWNEETPKSIYAALISMIIIITINTGLQTRKELTLLNKKKKENNFKSELQLTMKTIKIKHIIIFIIDLLLMVLFWYYCTCFCSIYSKTQLSLIATTFNAAFFCVIFIMLIYFLLCIIRITSLDCNSSCLYYFSSFFL